MLASPSSPVQEDILAENAYIDIHCHQLSDVNGFALLSVDMHDYKPELLQTGFCALGLHPWYISQQDCQTELELLATQLHNPNVLAVGECGLDSSINTPLALQRELFIQQIQLAYQANKPVIIHCVRAFHELLQLRKISKTSLSSSWIIHGFNSKPEIAAHLIKHGCYISFGKALVHANSHASQMIASLPINRVFLETDVSELTIKQIYALAAQRTGLNVESLKLAIAENFRRVLFGASHQKWHYLK
jgi:TatD DNase family protein